MKIAEKLYTQGWALSCELLQISIQSNKSVFLHLSPLSWQLYLPLFAQLHQLPSYRDQHFPQKPGPWNPGGGADAKLCLGDICPEGTRAAWRPQPTAGQEIWPSPSTHPPHQVQQFVTSMSVWGKIIMFTYIYLHLLLVLSVSFYRLVFTDVILLACKFLM